VHDLHPDYASTRYALARAHQEGLEVAAVQHHHAHVASCAAEHGLRGAVLGVAFDGAGYGSDGTIWGGEVLLMDGARFRRVAHLAPVAQPGGDQAARSPWRMAVAHLLHAGVDAGCVAVLKTIPAAELGLVTRLCARSSLSPRTSSVGRLFDAVAALLDGGCHRVSFEGRAAMWLEGMAAAAGASRDAPYPLEQREVNGVAILDPAPMIRAIVRDAAVGTSAETIAARFHEGLAEATARACARVAERTGIRDVVASGGCLVNGVLAEALRRRVEAAGLRAHFQRAVPPNDGGLCLGQLAVAAAMDEEGR
jgi:hydrogenase maturation protein HypF